MSRLVKITDLNDGRAPAVIRSPGINRSPVHSEQVVGPDDDISAMRQPLLK
jgi:hypothetical protein